MPFDFIDPTQFDDYSGYTGTFDPGPVAPQIFPDGSGGFTDLNGYAVDASGNPIDYSTVKPYEPLATDTTTTTDASGNLVTKDANGNLVTGNQSGGYDAAGNPIASTAKTTAAAIAAQQGAGILPSGGNTAPSSSLFGNLGKTLFGGGNTTPGGSSSTDWLLPLLGGAAAGYLLPKIASGFGGGNAPTVQAPNYLDQFQNIKAPSYAPLPAIQVGQNPGMNMQMPQAFPVAPRG